MAFFDFGDRGRVSQNLLWVAEAVFDHRVEGIMLYRTLGEEVTKYNFSAGRFYYQTSRARYLLLNWIARHIDQAERAEIWFPADEYPETWSDDLQVTYEAAERPAMSRVLDVEKLNGMQVGEGSFSAKIIDPYCSWNEGNWQFASIGGKLEVTPATAPECELTIQGLSALIIGIHEPQGFSLRSWGNPDPDLQSRMSLMFPKIFPFMHEMF
jgi:Sterol carrier protein domain